MRPLSSSARRARRRPWLTLALLLAGVILLRPDMQAFGEPPDTPPPVAHVIRIDGAIGPALADYLVREISGATETGADVIVLEMDTPGGLVTSMRKIIAAILAAPVPVITYVAPQGAHAASAGTYIFYASHIAAMAPGTNIGAATPIDFGGGPGFGVPKDEKPEDGAKPAVPAKPLAPQGASDLKAVNDLVSLIRSLAELRGRNADWGEKAVREAATLTATQAVAEHVADLVADDLPALLDAVDGRIVKVQSKDVTLRTKGATVTPAKIGWTTRVLIVLTDPNIAFILMTLGMYGLIFELSNPGAVLPGLVGGICLLIGLYALSVLPLNFAGVALILFGILFMVGEAMVPGHGIAATSGLIAFALGALFLVNSNVPGLRISWQTVAGVTIVTGLFLCGVIGYALTAQRRRVTTGREDLIGRRALVLDGLDPQEGHAREGFVRVEGERWHARSVDAASLEPGAEVVVKGVDGLVLLVARESAPSLERGIPEQRSP